MAYYDRIARAWDQATGRNGGALKKFVVNDLIIDRVGDIADKSILELGAGNGYFMPLLLRRFSGRTPARIVITDQSSELLKIAHQNSRLSEAEYLRLDVRSPFPFADGSFDLILATMLFNELSAAGARRACLESRRVLAQQGRLIITVIHPDFVRSLNKRGLLRPAGRRWTMPGSGGLPLPIVKRSKKQYDSMLTDVGLVFDVEEVYPSTEVVNAKPGLKKAGNIPIAIIYTCMQ